MFTPINSLSSLYRMDHIRCFTTFTIQPELNRTYTTQLTCLSQNDLINFKWTANLTMFMTSNKYFLFELDDLTVEKLTKVSNEKFVRSI